MGWRGNVAVVLAYPLQNQIDVGHLDVLMVMFENLLNRFDEVHVISLNDTGEYDLGKGIHVHPFYSRLPGPLRYVLYSFRLASLIRKHNIRAMRSMAPNSGLMTYAASKLTGVPYIYSVHGHLELQQKWASSSRFKLRLQRWMENRAFAGTSVIGVINELIKDYAVENGADERKIFVHRNFVDTNLFKPVEKENTKIKKLVFLGRLDKHKGVDYLIKAMPLILEREKATLTIAGNGPEREKLEALVKELKLENQVRFLGKVDHEKELPKVLGNSDIFVSPLMSGFTLLESMSCGLPVVGADVEWTKEIVILGKTGILVEAGNSKALADGVVKLIRDRKLYEKMRTNTRKMIEKEFSIESYKERELEMYDRILKGT
jgi:glycosyltransferase involved in cell wall biosynthesis